MVIYMVIYIVIEISLFFCFYVRILAELNQNLIDLVEGDSELISGFNVEYFRIKFALIFIVEYGIIVFRFIFRNLLYS